MKKSGIACVLCITLVKHVFADSVGVSSRSRWALVGTYQNLLPPQVNASSAFPVRSKLHCAVLCESEAWCNSFFYNDVSRTCALQFVVYVTTQGASLPAAGWNYFRFKSASCPWNTGVRDRDYTIDRGSMTCFRVVTSQTKQWWSARDACTSNGDMLAVLEPLEKAKFIDEFLNTNYVNPEDEYFLIGGRRPQLTCTYPCRWPSSGPDFTWLNGQPVNYTATASYWYNNSPDNYDRETVLALRSRYRFPWDDIKATEFHEYICERPLIY